jgi:HlyD family secretion protein
MNGLKRVLRWWPAVLILALVAGGVIAAAKWLPRGESETTDLTQVFTAQRGDLVAAISPTGEIYAPRQIDLSFDVSKIELIELNVSPGQTVKAGEILARIDSTALERAVLQAEADLTVAQDNLDTAQNPYTEHDLIQARLDVAQAEMSLEEAEEGLEEARNPYTELDLIQARLAVSQTEVALQEAKDNLVALLDPDTEAARAAVRDAAEALETARSQLTVAEASTENAAKIRTLESEMIWYRNNYWDAQKKYERGEISEGKLKQEYLNLVSAEEKLLVAQTNADISLTSARNKVTDAEEALRDVQENLAELQSGPDSTERLQAEVKIAQAEYDLAQAQESLAEIEAGPDPKEVTRAETQVAQAELNLAQAQESLAEIEAGPDPKEIELAEAKVVSAQATLEEAQAALLAGTMIAPFDGTVISVGAELGDLVSANNVIVSLTDLSNLRVMATVDETDIGLVEIGNQVNITFDAFPSRRFTGQVLEVPLQGNLVQNVLTYEVPVSLEGRDLEGLRPGMTANLTIVVGQRQNALLVPALAVQLGEEGYVVLVQDTPEGSAVATPVQVGLSDGTYVEVVAGLIEGDQVVVQYEAADEQNPFMGGIGGMPGGVVIRQGNRLR